MPKKIDFLDDAYGNRWELFFEDGDRLSATNTNLVYLAVNGKKITMSIPIAQFKTTYNNTFFNTLRSKVTSLK